MQCSWTWGRPGFVGVVAAAAVLLSVQSPFLSFPPPPNQRRAMRWRLAQEGHAQAGEATGPEWAHLHIHSKFSQTAAMEDEKIVMINTGES